MAASFKVKFIESEAKSLSLTQISKHSLSFQHFKFRDYKRKYNKKISISIKRFTANIVKKQSKMQRMLREREGK